MAFLNALNQQWEKSNLSQLLSKKIKSKNQICQFFTGATNLSSVTCMMAALVYSEGRPDWLPKRLNNNLTDEQVLNCLLISCQLLFIKALQENDLSQCERLIFTLANIWANNLSSKNYYICNLINKVCYQLDEITTQTRLKYKSIM